MSMPSAPKELLLRIILTLNQYPLLNARMRMRMRRMLFDRGSVKPADFEAEVRTNAIESQIREGMHDPLTEEQPDAWEQRLNIVREQLTDYYFSLSYNFDTFEGVVRNVLKERGVPEQEGLLSINPELAPTDLIFEQAMTIERMPEGERARHEARLSESKVVLIRMLISDQLRYINIAKEWFTISDLAEIRRRKIGYGKIGGKAAGMLLAARILKEVADEPLRSKLRVPESYFVGSDMLYTYLTINNLVHWNDQKYKPEDQMRAEYPQIQADFLAGDFPPDVLVRLEGMLDAIGPQPLIVRSSSLLEDNFGTSFAGKYESIFCPNQGTPQENLRALTQAIATVYSTVFNPNALVYRRSKGLQDYDERMALLIQVVEGEKVNGYYLPQAAGVAFSRNLYRWSPQIRREDGFLRLVWGMGTRAVDRVGNDYPRLVALSHPTLRPSTSVNAIRRYSQQYVDVIDLKANTFRTLPAREILTSNYDPLRYIAQVEQDGFFSSLRTNIVDDPRSLYVTFEDLLRRTPFAEYMRQILHILEHNYHAPVDMEFVANVKQTPEGKPDVTISILQCRPQSYLIESEQISIPTDLKTEDIVFSTRFIVPRGQICDVEYVLFVPPAGYFQLESENARNELVRTIGQVNAALAGKTFICVGPGRWGTSNADLGVPVNYGDIYNARSLVEISGELMGGIAPEPSLGTHFFQDLLEAQIYPLALDMNDDKTILNKEFFYDAPSCLAKFLPGEAEELADALRLIDVHAVFPGCQMDIVMDDNEGQAVGYFIRGKTPSTD